MVTAAPRGGAGTCRASRSRPPRRPARAAAPTAGGSRPRARGAPRGRRSTRARPARRVAQRLRHRDQVLGGHDRELAGEAVQAGDPVLAVVAGGAGVGRALRARVAVAARAPHGRGDEVAGGEAVAARSTRPSSSWPRMSGSSPGRGDPEQALRDLAVGPADADLERPHEQLAAAGRGAGISATAALPCTPGVTTSACIRRAGRRRRPPSRPRRGSGRTRRGRSRRPLRAAPSPSSGRAAPRRARRR